MTVACVLPRARADSEHKDTFPRCWDVSVGGHIEAGWVLKEHTKDVVRL
jgi:isopentenyldiphosphate isomerase